MAEENINKGVENLPHRILCLSKSMAGISFSLELHDKTKFTIGRSPEADIHIVQLPISGKHCTITIHEDETLSIEDLKSTNGTYLNGLRISMRTELNDGDIIALGDFEMIYRKHGSKNQPSSSILTTTTVNLNEIGCDPSYQKTMRMTEMKNFSPFKHEFNKKAGKYINIGIGVAATIVLYLIYLMTKMMFVAFFS